VDYAFYIYILFLQLPKPKPTYLIKETQKERHAMKCETQCHMLCLKHPSLYFLFFLGLQKLKATTTTTTTACPYSFYLPSLSSTPKHSFQTNPKIEKFKIKYFSKITKQI
jgi:hypothetical protein